MLLLKPGQLKPDPLMHPQSLGFALLAASDICRVVSLGDRLRLAALFDGGEDRGPNLDTRMRCVRDLCSAASFAINLRAQGAGREPEPRWSVAPPKIAKQIWHAIVRQHANAADARSVSEVIHLLDDAFESLLCVSECLKEAGRRNRRAWGEISRHITHVRDHFDYAEQALISSMKRGRERPSAPGGRDKGRRRIRQK